MPDADAPGVDDQGPDAPGVDDPGTDGPGVAGPAAGAAGSGAGAAGGDEVSDPGVTEVVELLEAAERALSEADELLHTDPDRARPRYEDARNTYQRALDAANENDVEFLKVDVEGHHFERTADILDRIDDANDGLDATS